MSGGGMGAEGVKQTSTDNGQSAYTPNSNSPTFTNFANTPLATNFSESEYLNAYKDVADAVRRGDIKSGMQHYLQYGQSEGRTPGPGAVGGQALDYLNRPFNDQQYLAANPDVAQAIADRRFTGTGREHYLMAGQSEGRAPSAVANRGSSITTPSYYNTNPYAVDYVNIFNPQATQVAYRQQSLTPQQQAGYLDEWQQDYSTRARAATQAANQARINTANAQWEAYLKDKASRESQATIDAAVAAKEKEIQDQYAANRYTDQSQYMTLGGKAGGSVPGGLRSLKGKTKP